MDAYHEWERAVADLNARAAVLREEYARRTRRTAKAFAAALLAVVGFYILSRMAGWERGELLAFCGMAVGILMFVMMMGLRIALRPRKPE